MKLGRYALRNLLNTKFFDYKTDAYMFRMDYATGVENDWKANSVAARGGDGAPKRVIFNDSKESTLKISTQIFTLQHLGMMSGGQVKWAANDATNTDANAIDKTIYKHEQLIVSTVSSAKVVTLAGDIYNPDADTTVPASEVKVVKFENGIQGDAVTVSSVDKATGDWVVTMTGVTDGDVVEVVYQAKPADAHYLTVTARDFPSYVKIVGDAIFADEVSGELVLGQVTYYKTKVEPNFNLKFMPTGDPTTIDMNFDILSAIVGTEEKMAEFVVYEE